MVNDFSLILAGGLGTRFWPLSTPQKPKQFLRFFYDRTMLEETLYRLDGLIANSNRIVATSNKHKSYLEKQRNTISISSFIFERYARNTAPCIALAAWMIYHHNVEAKMIVLPADHVIGNTKQFVDTLKYALNLADTTNGLITIGIAPTYPETGYGYVECIRKEAYPFNQQKEITHWRVRRFVEKPNYEKASQFLSSQRFLWNSGIFIWKAKVILDSLKQHIPVIWRLLQDVPPLVGADKMQPFIDTYFELCPTISIDYGVMEHAENVYMVLGNFGWNDIGDWHAAWLLDVKDKNQNVSKQTSPIYYQSKGNYVYGEGERTISLVGVKDLVVIDTPNGLLVCHRDKVQDVKHVVNILAKRKP